MFMLFNRELSSDKINALLERPFVSPLLINYPEPRVFNSVNDLVLLARNQGMELSFNRWDSTARHEITEIGYLSQLGRISISATYVRPKVATENNSLTFSKLVLRNDLDEPYQYSIANSSIKSEFPSLLDSINLSAIINTDPLYARDIDKLSEEVWQFMVKPSEIAV